jgi:hypothetical protein
MAELRDAEGRVLHVPAAEYVYDQLVAGQIGAATLEQGRLVRFRPEGTDA